MVKFRFTKKAQKKIGVVKSDEFTETERFMTWHVNDFKDSRRTGLIFMNDLTRFSVIIFGLKKSDFGHINDIFKKQLQMNLIGLGIEELRVKRYMKNFDSIVIDDSSDRSVLGSINDYLRMMPYWIEGEDTSDTEFVNYINDKFNDTPVSPLERDGFEPFPDRAMFKVLKAE